MPGGLPVHSLPLPSSLPLFPLTGVLLLPRGLLPLNIFEPRYVNMFDDAIAGDRLIGMVQPSEAAPTGANPPLYKTGCAGRITRFAEEGDRYVLTLTGVCRFDVIEEAPTTRLYRRAVPDWSPYGADLAEPVPVELDRPRLLDALKPFLRGRGLQIDWQAIESTPDEQLINALAMICPFGPAEKQGLLLAVDLAARAQLLTSLVEMAVLEPPGGSARH